MQLPQEALTEFKEIWQNDHPGQVISDEQLLNIATKVLVTFDCVYKDFNLNSFQK